MKIFYKLKELPLEYRYALRTGDVSRLKDCQYYYSAPAWLLMLILTIISSPFLLITVMLIVQVATYLITDFDDFLGKTFGNDMPWWGSLLVLGLIGLTTFLYCLLLYFAALAPIYLIRDIQIRNDDVNKRFRFGLLLTSEHLVWRKKNPSEPILMIAWKDIESITYHAEQGSKGSKHYFTSINYRNNGKLLGIRIGDYEFQTTGQKDWKRKMQEMLAKYKSV